LTAGFRRRHAKTKVVFDVQLQMTLQFRGEFAFAAALTEEFREPDEERAQLPHKFSCPTNG
jgi:hypothetical protein